MGPDGDEAERFFEYSTGRTRRAASGTCRDMWRRSGRQCDHETINLKFEFSGDLSAEGVHYVVPYSTDLATVGERRGSGHVLPHKTGTHGVR